MGTRASIARRDGDSGWSGTYVHSDGGPGHLGRVLVGMVRDRGAEATLALAETAPQGWTQFPDEPSIYHTDPLVLAPGRDAGIAWLYLITDDSEIKVYRANDRDGRRYDLVGIIDPLAADAAETMAALDDADVRDDGFRADRRGPLPDFGTHLVRQMSGCPTLSAADAFYVSARQALLMMLDRLRRRPGMEAEADVVARELARLDVSMGRQN
jgi:hypothetical protein